MDTIIAIVICVGTFVVLEVAHHYKRRIKALVRKETG